MPTITPIEPTQAQGEVKELFDGLSNKLGRVPNIFRNMANSPAVLSAYLGLSGKLAETSLSPQLREQIALVVAQDNNCNYCLAAHSAIAKTTGMEQPEILQSRRGESEDSKTKAILNFSQLVVKNRAEVTPEQIAALKATGVSDQELVEVMLVIATNIFTNYFNHVTDPEVDFPEAPAI